MLYSNKPKYYNLTTIERRTFNSTTPADITYLNIELRIKDFQDILKSEHVYRVPLRYFCDIEKINFPLKIDFKIKCHRETDIKKLFEWKKKVNAISTPDAKIIFTKAPFLQYEQFLLAKNFRQHLETIMVSKKILRMGVQKTPVQNHMKFLLDLTAYIDLLGSNRQSDWLEISLIYDKSDKHNNLWQLQCRICFKIYKKRKARKFYRNLQLDKWK